jgi:prepilin-type N-terminal cleavage/methylation domain-containing protein
VVKNDSKSVRRLPRAGGFSLIEALVALAILALALLLGLGLIFQQKRTILRLQARSEADAALSEALERLRSGSLPPSSGPVPVTVAAEAARDLAVVMLVTPAEPPADLYLGRLLVRYTVAGEPEARTVETMFWRPGLVKPP